MRTYHDELRAVMPVTECREEPAEGTVMARNAELLARRSS